MSSDNSDPTYVILRLLTTIEAKIDALENTDKEHSAELITIKESVKEVIIHVDAFKRLYDNIQTILGFIKWIGSLLIAVSGIISGYIVLKDFIK